MGTIFYIKPGTIRRAKRHLPFCYVIFSAALLFFGCSILPLNWGRTAMPPVGAFSKAELSLRTAGEARADELAPMDLQRAKEKLEQAKRAMAAGRNIEARRLAEAAEVEAELAEARAEAEIMRLAADNLRRRGDALRREMEDRRKTRIGEGNTKRSIMTSEGILHTWKGRTTVLSLLAFLSASCGGAVHNPALERARDAYERARRDPAVVGRAGVALEKARLTLEEAERVWAKEKDANEVEHLVYLTEKRAEIALATARRRIAADEIQQLRPQR